MKTKLRTTYLVTVLFFLFVTVGSMILFYNMFSEEFIIANNKKIMNSVFEDAQGMDLSSLTKSFRTKVELLQFMVVKKSYIFQEIRLKERKI